MKVLVLCQECGKQLLEVTKDQVTDADLREYEVASACEDHGGNEYERDEDGIIVSQLSAVIKAVRKSD
jgi:protein-arginine kinase activator protein McsA